jgi:hypothetical protein
MKKEFETKINNMKEEYETTVNELNRKLDSYKEQN